MKKEAVLNKKGAVLKKLSQSIIGDKPRGVRVLALLNTAATLGAAVLVAATSSSKKPPGYGD